MQIADFVEALECEFYTGVPDSKLRILVDYLLKNFGNDGKKHIIGANEGNCAAIATGYHLATGKVPVVYLQNSGIGNIINPVLSLLHEQVYGIPCIFIVGWRGEPGVHDEPQHLVQGAVSTELLRDIGMMVYAIDDQTEIEQVKAIRKESYKYLTQGKQVALLVKQNAFQGEKNTYHNKNSLIREKAVETILTAVQDNFIVATTGKTSREIYEIRERRGQQHDHDFLTVGSMGHASSIALGLALHKPQKKIWCIDGDGASIMHLGSMAVIGSTDVANFCHIIINNGAHESVGGQPTAGTDLDFSTLALNCGYTAAFRVQNMKELKNILTTIKEKEGKILLQIDTAIGSRKDLGRPKESPRIAKDNFMQNFLG